MRDRLIAVLGEVALYYSSNKNYIKALEYVKRMKQIGGLRSFHKAYEATLYLMLNEFSIAESQFRQITLENATAKDPDDRYSYLYCRSILSSIEGNEGAVARAVAEAEIMLCRSTVRRYIPLFNEASAPPGKEPN